MQVFIPFFFLICGINHCKIEVMFKEFYRYELQDERFVTIF